MVIQSDKQSEVNNVLFAEGNVSVSYRGKQLKADKLIYDKLNKKISAEGNITLFFGKQIFKISKLEYNFKNETGYLLDVKGSIDSDKLITDISGNLNDSDFQKLQNSLNLQKKVVLNTLIKCIIGFLLLIGSVLMGKSGRVIKQYFLMISFNLNK